MKKIISFLIISSLLFRVYGKEHSLYIYKATIKNDSNIIFSDRIVNVKLSILKGSFSGEPIYIEQQKTKSDEDGDIQIEIGKGLVEKGNFTLIDLSKGNFWLQSEIDPLGGTNYSTPVVQEMEENEHEYGHIDSNSGNFFKTLIRDLFNSWSVRILLIFSLGMFLFVKFELWNLFSPKTRRSYRFINLETKKNVNSQINTNSNISQSNKNSNLDTNISIPQTNFFQDLISGDNLTCTLIFISCLIGGYLVLFSGKFLFESYDKIGGSILLAILSLIVLIIGAIMMLAGVVGIGAALIFLFPAIPEVLFYNRNKKRAIQIAKEKAISEAKQRKEQAEFELQEKIRIQKELDEWNKKSPLEKAKAKNYEIFCSLISGNPLLAKSIYIEWKIELEKHLGQNDDYRDNINWLNNELNELHAREAEKKRIHEEKVKLGSHWQCSRCGTVVHLGYYHKPMSAQCTMNKREYAGRVYFDEHRWVKL
jgi:hypothetical protein